MRNTIPSFPKDLFPLDPRLVAKFVLELDVVEPEIILRAPLQEGGPIVDVAGVLDRPIKRITVAQRYKWEQRRYTLAHEIGHFQLHPDLTMHRDRVLNGGERANAFHRPPKEQEADLFAAELLMPERAVRREFQARFGVDAIGPDFAPEKVGWFTIHKGYSVDPAEFASKGHSYRAFLVANCVLFEGKPFPSLPERFGVSPSAMAIQLKDHRLIL